MKSCPLGSFSSARLIARGTFAEHFRLRGPDLDRHGDDEGLHGKRYRGRVRIGEADVDLARVMSAFRPRADIVFATDDVRLVPGAAISGIAKKATLLTT